MSKSIDIQVYCFQESFFPFCTSDGLDCVAKVAKEAFDCETPCTGLYAEVFRADDTELTTDLMRLANIVNGLEKKGYLKLNDKIP